MQAEREKTTPFFRDIPRFFHILESTNEISFRARASNGLLRWGEGGSEGGGDLLEAEWRVVTRRVGRNLCDEWRDTTSFFVLKYVTDGVARATVHARDAIGRGERIRAANIRAPTVAERSGGRLKTGSIRRGRRLGSFYGLWFHS